MSLRKLPEIKAERRLGPAQFDMRPDALERWEPEVRAAESGDNAISIYDPIGENWEGTGVTAKRISAALRSIGQKDVVVNVNSPGGDFFEGVAIYNLLREHQAKVTVNVMGLAASAASVIAMAGDEVLMGDGSFLMIHTPGPSRSATDTTWQRRRSCWSRSTPRWRRSIRTAPASRWRKPQP